ncbi:MAG TPA: ATP-binding protein [Anaeromyxobacteraceae bacterium]|nr:ATP-binding protein [Anaeromyxobacteraceae bacterium]
MDASPSTGAPFRVGFAALGAAALAASFAGVHYVRRMADSAREISDGALPALDALLRAQRGIGAVRFTTARAVVDGLMGNEEAVRLLSSSRARALREAEAGLSAFEGLPRTREAELLWGKVKPAFREFAKDNGGVWAALQAGDAVEAARLQGRITQRLPDRFLDSFDDLVELQGDVARQAAASARTTSAIGTRVLLGIGLAALLGAAGLAVLVGRAQAARIASEERLRLFVERAPVAIAMLDRDLRFMAVSRRWKTDFGLDGRDPIGRRLSEVQPAAPDGWTHGCRRCLEGEDVRSDRDSCRRGDGVAEWVRWEMHPWRTASGAVGGILVASEVTTERVRLEARLAVASRLAALGTLVAGLCHEINNPLAALLCDEGFALGHVRETRERLNGTDPLDRASEARALDDVVEALESASASGQRIAAIVKDLADFGRIDAKRSRVGWPDVVALAMRWLPESVGRAAHVRFEDGGAPDVLASPGQVAQVVANLVSNAAKAMRKDARGEIVMRAGPGMPGMSRLEVIDNGTGIDPSIRERIFDPFFTTRPTGEERGTGLGLAISHAIVTSHGGTISVDSTVGAGSTFRLELPVASDAA